jgi:hypothetical protein
MAGERKNGVIALFQLRIRSEQPFDQRWVTEEKGEGQRLFQQHRLMVFVSDLFAVRENVVEESLIGPFVQPTAPRPSPHQVKWRVSRLHELADELLI